MKTSKYIAMAGIALLFAGCNTDVENIPIQVPYEKGEQYWADLRAYKESDHPLCFGWYAMYSSDGNISGASKFTGLPDSMDIVSLWSAIPSNNPEYVNTNEYNERYLPNAYEEMHYIRKVKGTKIVDCTICHLSASGFSVDDEGMREYAMSLVRRVLRNDLDGIDLDYEPQGDYLTGDKFTEFVKIIGQYVGPMSGSGKLFIIDYHSVTPPAETLPYVDYYVHQVYTNYSANPSTVTDTDIDGYGHWGSVKSWCPPEKWMPAEHLGWWPMEGGRPWRETKRDNPENVDSRGNPLYTVVGLARWNPDEGRKGGFGAFYFEDEYYTQRPANADIGDTETKAMPYYSLRQGIQEQNPARPH